MDAWSPTCGAFLRGVPSCWKWIGLRAAGQGGARSCSSWTALLRCCRPGMCVQRVCCGIRCLARTLCCRDRRSVWPARAVGVSCGSRVSRCCSIHGRRWPTCGALLRISFNRQQGRGAAASWPLWSLPFDKAIGRGQRYQPGLCLGGRKAEPIHMALRLSLSGQQEQS